MQGDGWRGFEIGRRSSPCSCLNEIQMSTQWRTHHGFSKRISATRSSWYLFMELCYLSKLVNFYLVLYHTYSTYFSDRVVVSCITRSWYISLIVALTECRGRRIEFWLNVCNLMGYLLSQKKILCILFMFVCTSIVI